MPVYEKVSISDLRDLLAIVDSDIQTAVSEGLHNLLAYCIVLLYEYCVCMSYMRVNNVTVIYKAKATVNTIKSAMYDSDESLRSILNVFRNTRDALCHTANQVSRRQAVRNVLRASVFYTTLEYFDVPISTIISLKEYYAKNFLNDSDQLDYTQQKVGDTVDLSSTVSVGDCTTPEDFDPFNYIRQKVGDKVNLLPVVAVCNCKTPEDCHDLIDSLAHLL